MTAPAYIITSTEKYGADMMALHLEEMKEGRRKRPTLPHNPENKNGSKLTRHERVAACLSRHGPSKLQRIARLLSWEVQTVSSALDRGKKYGTIKDNGKPTNKIYRVEEPTQ
jgi:hypothetical protein